MASWALRRAGLAAIKSSAAERPLRWVAGMHWLAHTLAIALAVMSCVACTSYRGKSISASIPELRAHPERFRGARVIISGYAREVGGQFVLYLTEQHAAHFDDGAAIYVHTVDALGAAQACAETWVSVVGTFGEVPGLLVHGIREVESIARSDTPGRPNEQCWPPVPERSG